VKVLNRRGFLSTSTKIAAAGIITAKIMKPTKVQAQEADKEGLELQSEISNNHGHALELSVAQLIASLRETQVNETTALISIQGQSHPHDIELSAEEITSIILGEEVLKASVGGNHSHQVLVRLNVI